MALRAQTPSLRARQASPTDVRTARRRHSTAVGHKMPYRGETALPKLKVVLQ